MEGLQLFVSCYMAVAVYCHVFVCTIPWLGVTTSGVANLGFFLVGMHLLAYCYYKACITDPGRPTQDWDYDIDTEAAGASKMRYCTKCEVMKPPRAHHCSMCKRCVLRMDHHCPWINNCVGHGNYKFFFLFLFYTTACAIHLLTMMGGRLFSCPESLTAVEGTVVCIVGFITFLCAFLVGMLFLYHVSLILRNYTTIEYQELSMMQHYMPDTPLVHEFDIGTVANVTAILGANPLIWLLPLPVVSGTGHSYPTNPAYNPEAAPKLTRLSSHDNNPFDESGHKHSHNGHDHNGHGHSHGPDSASRHDYTASFQSNHAPPANGSTSYAHTSTLPVVVHVRDEHESDEEDFNGTDDAHHGDDEQSDVESEYGDTTPLEPRAEAVARVAREQQLAAQAVQRSQQPSILPRAIASAVQTVAKATHLPPAATSTVLNAVTGCEPHKHVVHHHGASPRELKPLTASSATPNSTAPSSAVIAAALIPTQHAPAATVSGYNMKASANSSDGPSDDEARDHMDGDNEMDSDDDGDGPWLNGDSSRVVTSGVFSGTRNSS